MPSPGAAVGSGGFSTVGGGAGCRGTAGLAAGCGAAAHAARSTPTAHSTTRIRALTVRGGASSRRVLRTVPRTGIGSRPFLAWKERFEGVLHSLEVCTAMRRDADVVVDLVVLQLEPFAETNIRALVKRALPRIEALTLALPPLDPEDGRGVGALKA